ncbi:MotA/TolQ/ExbB proton channel family protein [Leptolyngbya sp. 7M]|nr:MotA/TolQ/ExbB proton channel family protein [Leptolyngbya sp. 7M]
MSNLFELVKAGGPVMIPIVGLSVATIACALERAWFWYQLVSQEDRIVHDVLAAARYNLEDARGIAESAQHLPIGRFLLAPLKLRQPSPETFRLAMEAAGDKEFVQMRRGDKLLETVVAISPLLGLLGTVTGLIATFSSLNIGGGGTTESAAGEIRAMVPRKLPVFSARCEALLAKASSRTWADCPTRKLPSSSSDTCTTTLTVLKSPSLRTESLTQLTDCLR